MLPLILSLSRLTRPCGAHRTGLDSDLMSDRRWLTSWLPAVLIASAAAVPTAADATQPLNPLYLYVSNYYGAGAGVNLYNGDTGAFVAPFVSAGSGGLSRAGSMAYGPNGQLYVSSIGTATVKRYSAYDGSYVDDFASGNGIGSPMVLTFGPDHNLYIGSHGDGNQIKKVDGITGAFLGDFLSGRAMQSPYSILFGADGMAYVGMYAASAVARFNGQTGAFVDDFVPSGSGGLRNTTAIVFAPDGSLLVSSDSGQVKRYHGQTGQYLGDFAADISMTNPNELHFGPGGDLFVSHGVTNTIKRFDGTSGAFLGDFIVPGSGGLQFNQDFFFSDRAIAVVPEPGTVVLWWLGGLLVSCAWRRAAGGERWALGTGHHRARG